MPNSNNLLGQVFTIRQPRSYGWKAPKTLPTPDQLWVPHPKVLTSLKAIEDMRRLDGPIFDQGQLGSCVANGTLGDAQFVCNKQYGFYFQGSRLQVYYDGRVLENTVSQDSGLEVSDGIKVMSSTGACPETEWPYDISTFTQKPSPQCYVDAAKFKIVTFKAVQQDINHLKACLASGFPFIFGFNVPESFESSYTAKTGIMQMPKAGEQIIGGHCVMAIGYIDAQGKKRFFNALDAFAYQLDQAMLSLQHNLRVLTGVRLLQVKAPTNVIICRNSWGTGWGDKGYFYMPYAFITDPNWASDFWMIESIMNPKA